MTTVYKLTDQNMQTHGGYQWVLGEWHETSGEGKLCGPGWLHCYEDPILAVLLNPRHAAIANPRLFEAEADGDALDDRGMKAGVTRLRLVKELPLPTVTLTQRRAFGILCALSVYSEPKWVAWAEKWLSGEDRSANAAYAANAADAAYAAYADDWPGVMLTCALHAMDYSVGDKP